MDQMLFKTLESVILMSGWVLLVEVWFQLGFTRFLSSFAMTTSFNQRLLLTTVQMFIKDMCNDLLKEFVSNMNGVNRNEAGDGIYWIQTVKNKLEKSIVHSTHQNGAF